MASTLLSFPGLNKSSHWLKYSIGSPQVLLEEMLVMDLQKPMISFIFIWRPVSTFFIGLWILSCFWFFDFVFFLKDHIGGIEGYLLWYGLAVLEVFKCILARLNKGSMNLPFFFIGWSEEIVIELFGLEIHEIVHNFIYLDLVY